MVKLVRVGVGGGGGGSEVVLIFMSFVSRYGTACTFQVHTLVPLYLLGFRKWFRSGSEGGSDLVSGSEWFRFLGVTGSEWVGSGLFATLDGSSDG